ncbi:hypothetical protein GCK72_025873 [Caenorhabditis remanei]|uniref:SET domain-containing protein n=1 Tax=Caenorhabditis remanei TaxID=31234 RepID=A0A6A5G3W0_CAERE|nr:hypothetical protein GCK72_025873 [Caenorhabditis remanei]KAF1749405.1 hypothetical protein GCK72_025873 [Caenorhabditis remanei]
MAPKAQLRRKLQGYRVAPDSDSEDAGYSLRGRQRNQAGRFISKRARLNSQHDSDMENDDAGPSQRANRQRAARLRMSRHRFRLASSSESESEEPGPSQRICPRHAPPVRVTCSQTQSPSPSDLNAPGSSQRICLRDAALRRVTRSQTQSPPASDADEPGPRQRHRQRHAAPMRVTRSQTQSPPPSDLDAPGPSQRFRQINAPPMRVTRSQTQSPPESDSESGPSQRPNKRSRVTVMKVDSDDEKENRRVTRRLAQAQRQHVIPQQPPNPSDSEEDIDINALLAQIAENHFDNGTDEAMVARDETVDEINAQFAKMTIATVVDPAPSRKRGMHVAKVQVLKKFQCKIPNGCIEANKGQQFGSWHRDAALEYPGIPTRKFCEKDMNKYGKTEKNWSIQTIFSDPTARNQFWLYYVGWSCKTMWLQKLSDFASSASEMVEHMKIRNTFLAKLKRSLKTPELKKLVDREKCMDETIKSNPDHIFWLYQDMSFFHTKIQQNEGLGLISYMCLREKMKLPPKFAYTTVNVMKPDIYQICVKNSANRRFTSMRVGVNDRQFTACEKPSTCKCNMKFEQLFASYTNSDGVVIRRKNRQPNKDCVLNLDGFEYEEERIVIECSDACGCSYKCPRRQLQRGQQKYLVVFYEGDRGFGVRAAEFIKQGEFIMEYVGEIMALKKDDHRDRDVSYDVKLTVFDNNLVISSALLGNVARFLGHACQPNATFIECYSRKCETDPLFPRIGAFATSDINIGEEITISYFHPSQLLGTTGIKCSCRETCPNYLPTADAVE